MTALAHLERALTGRLHRPDADGFAELTAREFAALDDPPAAVAQVRTTAEVVAAVRGAREAGLSVAVRSGGHSYAHHSAGPRGLVLDVRGLDSVSIDPDALVGHAGGGATAGAYSRAAGEHGLATGFGDAGTVGVAGIALGGGIGFLSRRDGLTVDNVLAAEVVLADGSVVTADPEHHPDLFWALRGGGGNFGVVTSLTLRLHPTSAVTGGMLVLEPTPERLAAANQAVLDAADGLSAMINLLVAPPAPFLPESLHGRPIMLVLVCWSGPEADAAEALAPLRALGQPLVDDIGPRAYADMLQGPPRSPQPLHPVMRTGFTDRLDEQWAATAIEAVTTARTFTALNLRPMGGAIARVPVDATAFAHRHHAVMASVAAPTPDVTALPTAQAWADATAGSLGLVGAGYMNFMSERTADDVVAAYPGGILERLREVKRTYDPGNVFRYNHNVTPAPAGPGG
ncbi:FAD/FMN-containing dehydrogenase [Georgenia satyanarayanai]|uniref:FAD/FMN-containing dehydrogenase n=1 Tax=Georgenia satyanarayanai TaxID=860221 RepID=A0A2Y9A6X6_9MICO|nr:FAD-binding oxidoreductase [Georgenia satyanarayanai]PYG00909.1 FAD/FMN-containing dehydrogenase [Georgenia satyanarayanai]SSA39148.1 FAD/FMN-containing dehydrogenase [Georgenia satyanarayanai]